MGKGSKQAAAPQGGGSGMVAYKKNIEISKTESKLIIHFSWADIITQNLGTVLEYESNSPYSIYRIIFCGDATNENGASQIHYRYSGNDQPNQLDGYGSNGGGLYTHNTYCGGAGSGSNGTVYGATGGAGGDGMFGYGSDSTAAGYGGTRGIIPLTSIFGGDGAGGNGYNNGIQHYCGSAGGYSQGDVIGVCYGSGLNYWNGSKATCQGIVCLYYHDNLI